MGGVSGWVYRQHIDVDVEGGAISPRPDTVDKPQTHPVHAVWGSSIPVRHIS